jgi:hypothetical protein
MKVDFTLELENAGSLFLGFADFHGLWIAGMREVGKMNLVF